MTRLLVLNTGSSSIKARVFGPGLAALATAQASGIGAGPAGRVQIDATAQDIDLPDHDAALAVLLGGLAARGLPVAGFAAAAHRVVHGGTALTAPCRITAGVLAEIAACVPLAPLHNPPALAAIAALARLAPGLVQLASFDTAFHAGQPAVATTYALPPAERAKGLRRYGFHGISFAGLVAALPGLTGGPLPDRLLALHLGNGASLCAIRAGRSVATTMGYSPLSGLTMGTRTGEIDGNAVLRLAEDHGIAGAARILNHDSGLKGLAGLSDMRALHAAGTDEAAFALDHFCYWVLRHAGSMIAALEGLDAVAFTGGIGENDALLRGRIMAGLEWLGLRADPRANAAGGPRLHAAGSAVGAWVVAADEERTIAREALTLLG